jgi:hypothetical protein
MDESLAGYLVFVALGIGMTLLVGQLLIRSGRVYLEELFDDRRLAGSMTTLLAVLFHLVVLGVLGVISTIDVPVDGAVQLVVTKLGVVLLVIGVAHASALALLGRMRDRRAQDQLFDSRPFDSRLSGRPRATGTRLTDPVAGP